MIARLLAFLLLLLAAASGAWRKPSWSMPAG